MNYYNISRATQGLVRYIKEYLANHDPGAIPSLAIAYDTRFFSKEFGELAAKVASENGCTVFLFETRRSTPELSFAVRHTNSTAGVVITASHNPAEYNGFKVVAGASTIHGEEIQQIQSLARDSIQYLPNCSTTMAIRFTFPTEGRWLNHTPGELLGTSTP